MSKEEILFVLKGKLLLNLPLSYSDVFLNADSVRFLGQGKESWEIKYEPQKGATTALQVYLNTKHVRGFETPDQVISYFYAIESAQ